MIKQTSYSRTLLHRNVCDVALLTLLRLLDWAIPSQLEAGTIRVPTNFPTIQGATALRNPLARLLLMAPLFAIWVALQFPALLFAYSEAQSFLPNKKIIGPETTRHLVNKISGRLPLYFEANHGQADKQVKFVSRGRGYTLSLTPSEVVVALQNPSKKKPAISRRAASATNLDRNDADLHAQGLETTVRMRLVGATAEPKVIGFDELIGKSNYFIGNDPKKWRKNVPHYAKVRYEEVYPGIDLVFYGNESQLEFDFIVAPGVNPDVIRMAFDGADKIDIDKEGHLSLQSPGGSVRVKKPFVYQKLDGVRQEISSRYLLNPSRTENLSSHVVAFELASYDPTKLLVIDPGLEFSTFLGGSGLDDGNGIALDGAGNIYVVGSTGFGYGVIDVFVAKFSADFTLLYASVFGGSTNGKIGVAGDWGRGIAVDAAGNAYVTGRIESSDFPTTDGTSPIGYADAFVAKLSSDGSALLFSRRLGGSGQSDAHAIVLDPQGSAYVTGWTSSDDFPTTPGAFDTTHHGFGYSEAFVVKLSADGSQLLYSTFLGGTTASDPGGTRGFAIAVDTSGNAHVTGATGWFYTSEFPATPGAFDTSWNGGQDAFVAKLNADGSQLLYATYIGGGAQDAGSAIALDATGNAYVAGWTESSNFPTTPGALERIHGVDVGSGDAFIVKLSPDGSRLLYSTFLGGSAGDAASGIALDGGGNVYVIGSTCASDFPTTAGAFSESQISRCGIVNLEPNGDTFVAKLSADGSRLLYSTYLGGGAGDEGSGIVVDPAGRVYVTGRTNSLNFPTTPGAFDPGGGPWDAFVAKLSIIDTNVNPGTLGFDAIGYSVREDGGTAVITVIRRNGKDGEVSVDYTTGDSGFRPAAAGLDYLPTSGTLVFAHGETTKSFTVSILDDVEHEDDEWLLVTLSNVRGGATLGGNRPTVVLTITDQDPIFLPTLTVIKTGSGNGTVTSNFRRDIDCGSVCSNAYASGSSVTLTASAAEGSTFAGWNGGICSGTDSCTLTITADTSVTATFNISWPIVDFDSDGKTDVGIYRNGSWSIIRSSDGGITSVVWGGPSWIPVPADYDGDGKIDIAVYNASGLWSIVRSSDGVNILIGWSGAAGDIPVPADYDGDGKADLAVYNTATAGWSIIRSSDGGLTYKAWGGPGWVPVEADYDGDGKVDIAVRNPSNGLWSIVRSSDGGNTLFGWSAAPNDIPVPADYDGDDKADFAVYNSVSAGWSIIRSSDGGLTYKAWGGPGWEPVVADYDGDGRADIAVYNSSIGLWSILRSSDGGNTLVSLGGAPQDIPLN